jgi:DNA topoisomerase-1
VQKFDGFLKLYQEGRDEKTEEDEEEGRKLPLVAKGEMLDLKGVTPEQHFTEPPPRYTEATLVKALEEKGIGRPSTYAAILTTLLDREYVEKKEGRFHPAALGMIVSDMLVASFNDLFNETYTARMEQELDEIEEGKLKWTQALHGFYDKFSQDLKNASQLMREAKQKSTPTDETCEKCNSPMVIKLGRFGQFMACSNYPECRTTREIGKPKAETNGETIAAAPEANGETEAETCEICGKPMALRRGRFGQFLGCTGYPECKNIRKLGKTGAPTAPPVTLEEKCPQDGANLVKRQGRFGEFVSCSNYPKCNYIQRETTGVPCPRAGCKGEIVNKKSKRGKVFYGCSNYPKCDAVYWDKPVATPCPTCKAPFLLEKTTKRDGANLVCVTEGCDYRAPLSVAPAESRTTESASMAN